MRTLADDLAPSRALMSSRVQPTRKTLRAIDALLHEGYTSIEILEAAFANFRQRHPEKVSLRSKFLARYLCRRYMEPDQEVFGAIFFDTSNTLIADRVFFRGILTRVTVDPRPILAHALDCDAEHLAIFHTHPGGLSSPSPEDQAVTERVRMATTEMQIGFHGHLIIANGTQLSRKPMDIPCWLQWLS